MKIISFRTTLSALFALILLIEILLCSSFCLCHEEQIIHVFPSRERSFSRRLLLNVPQAASVSVRSTSTTLGTRAMEDQPKKAVESSLRKAPPSVANPTQNK
ncbi:hypothetical protein RchiOBHm_Chr3g0479931 [Rosa chinensis]|uniref:Uncharacterized protein n=1 Tax=Rosa chinensis TaxID=74649 RepID=A0A2P6RDH7_ROSCH|nr:hypothetical protein RchiOBHm_Chr3g0479931 [Rosa chinensis]